MSIKSQKSLNEECSEIIERSYSVRSLSNESLSCSDSEETLAIELMHRMTPAVLSKLRRRFHCGRRKKAMDVDRKVEEVMRQAAAEEGIEFAATEDLTEDSLWLDETGFVNAVNDVFGNHKYTTHAHHLFNLLDPFSTRRAWWRQLVCRLVSVGARKTRSRTGVWKDLECGRVKVLGHCKREAIVKLVSIETEDSFCYAAVSKGGRVGVYGGNMNLLHSYEIFYQRTGIRQRVKNRWITDAVYLDNVQSLVLSASDRSLTVYDTSTLTHAPLFYVTSLPHVPTCLAYSACTNELAIGTSVGDVIRLHFLQPRISLFYVSQPETVNCYLWMELSSPSHDLYVTPSRARAHSRSVRRLMYARDGDILLSCSHDTVGVRARHSSGHIGDYTFKVSRGVTCFHYIAHSHLLVTGSPDVARVWQLTQRTPLATLRTRAAVADVAIVASMRAILALCTNCWLYIWDMYEECLLQIIKIQFPFLGVLGKRVEFGAYSIHPGPAFHPVERPSSRTSLGSSVHQSSSGGMLLSAQPQRSWETRTLEEDPEYIRFNRASIMITCCECACVVRVGEARGEGKAAPRGEGGVAGARATRGDRPELPSTPHSSHPEELKVERSSEESHATPPMVPYQPLPELNELLENAGLQGILEKDLVLMRGLKSDLHKKLAEMNDRKESMAALVCGGAPYLSLRTYEPLALPPPADMMEQYSRVFSLFPGPSVTNTPSGSNLSTPRRSQKALRLDYLSNA